MALLLPLRMPAGQVGWRNGRHRFSACGPLHLLCEVRGCSGAGIWLWSHPHRACAARLRSCARQQLEEQLDRLVCQVRSASGWLLATAPL